MSVDIEDALKRVGSYISQVDKLLKMLYKEGDDRLQELDVRIENFVKVVFPDGDQKIADYRLSQFPFGIPKTEEEKQSDYVSTLKKMRTHLVAYREELELILTSREKSNKLEKIEKETKIAEAEAGRRAAVLEGKVLGGIIELLDMQRKELKRRITLDQEIINLRKEITDLKSMFVELKKYLERSLGYKFSARDEPNNTP